MGNLLETLKSPAAIAFSGGGDSTAMLHAFRNSPTVSHAFIIDHALRGGSAEEAAKAAKYANSFGYIALTDRWEHDGIETGIQVKARNYRYAALGRMCREAGIKHLITAHTADDQAETLLMRLDRQTGWRGLAGMPIEAYGPLWPALAGVTLHRPWLDKSRRSLRYYNKLHNLNFIDDPSNQNTDFARIRARQALAADPVLREDLLTQQIQMRARLTEERHSFKVWLAAHAVISPQGYVETNEVPPSELLLHILNAVSGSGGPIDAAKRARLCREMATPDFKAATLGGAWILRKPSAEGMKFNNSFVFLRDRVAVTGRENSPSIHPLKLNPQMWMSWDGRFLCCAKIEGLHVEPASGSLQKLRQMSEFKTIFDLPKEVRESLPVFFLGEKAIGFGACDSEYVKSVSTSASRLHGLFKGPETVPL